MLRRWITTPLLSVMIGVCWMMPSNAQQDRPRERQQNQQKQDQDRPQLRLDRTGTVTIGIDRNGDGRYEKVESIYSLDLEQARQRSSQRRSQQGSQQKGSQNDQQMRRASNRSDQQPNRARSANNGQATSQQQANQSQNPMKEFSGKIVEMISFNLSDGKEHKFAKVELENGDRVPVDMGRVELLKELKLRDGDQITIKGQRIRINDEKMVSARVIESGDQSVKVNRETDRGMKRVRGTVDKLVTAKFKGRDQQYQIARIDLKGGRTEAVILGAMDKLEKLELEKGDEVQILVRRGTRNDRPVLVADQIRANGQVVRLGDSKERNASKDQPKRG